MRTPALAASLALAVLGCGGAGYYQADITATATTPQYVEAAYIDPDVQVVVDSDVPMFYADDYYWRYYGNTWYRSPYADTGWVAIDYYALPDHVRRIERPERYAHYRVEPSKRVKIPLERRAQTVRRDQPARPETRRPTPTKEPDRYYPPKAPERIAPDRPDRPDRKPPVERDRPDVKDKPDVRPNPPPSYHEDHDVGPPADRGNARDRDDDNDNDQGRGNDDKDHGKHRGRDKDKDDKDKKDKDRHPDR